MILRVKGWREFQHYSKRRPPWIKLHHGLLDNRAFLQLPDASARLAPLLWLIASEHDGEIKDAINEISFRLRMVEDAVIVALAPLLEGEFFECEPAASADAIKLQARALASVLASCKPLSGAQSEERRGEPLHRVLSPLSSQDSETSCPIAARASEPVEALATPREDLPEIPNFLKRIPS